LPVIRSHKFSKLGHVTQVTPTYGSSYRPYVGRVRPLCLCQIWCGWRVHPTSLHQIWSGLLNSFKSY